jgi:hypothetical protein
MATGLNVFGLVASLVGVLLLFRYGMPYRVSQINEGSLFADGPSEKDKRLNRRYAVLGKIGLAAIVIGTVSQAVAQFL